MARQQGRSRREARARNQAVRQRRKLALVIFALAGAVAIGVVILTSTVDDEGPAIAELRLLDFGIDGDLEVPAGPVRLSAVNEGVVPHNVGIRGGPISNEVGPGGSISLDLGELAPGTYELYCDITGHEDQGMVAPFVVSPTPT